MFSLKNLSGRSYSLFYVLFLLAIIIGISLLLPQSNWMGDEYYQIGGMQNRSDRIVFILERLHWSPRPLSELCLFLYYEAVLHTRSALAASYNGLMWATYFLLTCLYARRPSWNACLIRLSIPMTFFVILAIRCPSYELLFWPAGVAPYLLTVAFILSLVLGFLDMKPENDAPSIWQTVLLVGMALSSEVGMVFAALWTVSCGAYGLIEKRSLQRTGRIPARMALPLLACAAVSWISITGRLTGENIYQNNNPLGRQLWTALETTFHNYTYGPYFNNHIFDHHLSSNIIFECAVFLGFYFLISSDIATSRRLVPFFLLTSAACVSAEFTVTFISLRHYGFLADRHQDICLFLNLVTLFCLAGAIAIRHPVHIGSVICRQNLGFLTLAICLLYITVKFTPLYYTSLSETTTILQDRSYTWKQGLSSADKMIFLCQAQTPLIPACPEGISPQTYTLSNDTPWEPTGIMWFFKKTTLTVQKH